MSGKKLLTIGGAVMLAAYLGTKLAGPPADGLALAAAGAGVEPAKGLVAVTTGAPGGNANRLILIDTITKRLAVYRIANKRLGLIALRSYNFDMKLDDSAGLPGQDFDYETVRDAVMKSDLREEDKKSLPAGRELVLTTDGDGPFDGNRIILVNTEEKRVVVYRLNGNQLLLVAARHYDHDLVPEFIRGAVPGDGYNRDQMVQAGKRRDDPTRPN